MNVSSFWNKAFAEVVELSELIKVNPDPIRRGEEKQMHLQDEQYQGLLANTRPWKRQGRTVLCRFLRKHGPASALILDFLPPELWKNNVYCFQCPQFVLLRYSSPRKPVLPLALSAFWICSCPGLMRACSSQAWPFKSSSHGSESGKSYRSRLWEIGPSLLSNPSLSPIRASPGLCFILFLFAIVPICRWF